MRIRESVQLQTVSALYDQEIDRDRATPSYQRLKTLVRRHVDQMIRTRNFRARNERIETGVRVKRQKREESQCGKQMDSVQEETLAVSATGIIVDNRHHHPLLLRRRRHRLTEEVLRQALAAGEKVLLEGKAKKNVQKLPPKKLPESVV